MTSKDIHMSLSKRQIIETEIVTGSSKKSVADTIKKFKSTISRKNNNDLTLKIIIKRINIIM